MRALAAALVFIVIASRAWPVSPYGSQLIAEASPPPLEKSWLVKLKHDPNAVFGAGVALFTLALVYVGTVQASRLRQTVEVTRDAAQALPMIERAYIFVRASIFRSDRTDPAERGYQIKLRFYNFGRTAAILTELRFVTELLSEVPQEIKSKVDRHLAPGVVIGPGEGPVERLSGMKTMALEKWADAAGKKIYCYGRIEYDDVLGVRHQTSFCFESNPDEKPNERNEMSLARESILNRRT